jgi:hypothetical protein
MFPLELLGSRDDPMGPSEPVEVIDLERTVHDGPVYLAAFAVSPSYRTGAICCYVAA